uniref:Uncharacterized protein n=1 Tax=Rhipicephalus microplus TaxID=6941 RepID=A0A6G5AID0_RHIMP
MKLCRRPTSLSFGSSSAKSSGNEVMLVWSSTSLHSLGAGRGSIMRENFIKLHFITDTFSRFVSDASQSSSTLSMVDLITATWLSVRGSWANLLDSLKPFMLTSRSSVSERMSLSRLQLLGNVLSSASSKTSSVYLESLERIDRCSQPRTYLPTVTLLSLRYVALVLANV